MAALWPYSLYQGTLVLGSGLINIQITVIILHLFYYQRCLRPSSRCFAHILQATQYLSRMTTSDSIFHKICVLVAKWIRISDLCGHFPFPISEICDKVNASSSMGIISCGCFGGFAWCYMALSEILTHHPHSTSRTFWWRGVIRRRTVFISFSMALWYYLHRKPECSDGNAVAASLFRVPCQPSVGWSGCFESPVCESSPCYLDATHMGQDTEDSIGVRTVRDHLPFAGTNLKDWSVNGTIRLQTC